MGLVKPQRTNPIGSYWVHYNKDEIDAFKAGINYITTPLTKTETLYIEGKGISQDKLRAAGFKITRIKANADLIVIEDMLVANQLHGSIATYFFTQSNAVKFEEVTSAYVLEEALNYTYIDKKSIYPYLYKYTGDKAMFESISELFNSKDTNNAKIAMEYISNANWEDNEIYLQEIFNMYYSAYIHDNSYRTSVSFKGFLETLEFSYKFLRLSDSDDYRELCITEEHHEWVYNKHDIMFKRELKHLLAKYKLKLNTLDVSIDYKKVKEEDDE